MSACLPPYTPDERAALASEAHGASAVDVQGANPSSALFAFQDVVCEPSPGHRIEGSGTVPANGVLVVRGPSGAGKSTLLKALARLLPLQSGRVWLKGRPMETWPAHQWRCLVHYSAQQPVAFDGTVLDNILLPFRLKAMSGRKPPTRDQVAESLAAVGLKDLNQDARTLSGGELARVALLRALWADPCVLLLDEPTAALDAATRDKVMTYLAEWLQAKPDRGIVLVSHADEDAS